MKLEIGYNTSFEVRKETYHWKAKSGFTILYISDFHFNRYSKNMASAIASKVQELNPDVVLLGGDYVDTSQGLVHFIEFMKAISHRKYIFAVAGNHDYFFGIEKVKEAVVNNNGIWIEKDSVVFLINESRIKIDGNKMQKKAEVDFTILCLHKPEDLKSYNDHYNLAFAGHLHGSQFVFWSTSKGMFPGRFFYKWNRLKMCINSCMFFISKGLGDTLPIRFNCRKDMIFVSVCPTDLN